MTTLLLDADEVLFDLVPSSRALFLENGIDASERKGRELYVSKEEKQRFADWVDARPNWVYDLPISAGVQASLACLRDLGVEVLCVTRPLGSSLRWYRERRRALVERLSFDPDDLYFCRDKSRIAGDVFVDDTPSHVRKWQLKNQSGVGILWQYPDTDHEELHHQSMRTKDWNQVISVVRQFIYYEQGAR